MNTWFLKTPFGILQGAEQRCLDWRKAVDIIKQNYRPDMIVYAGIKEDWKDTAGIIFKNGQSVNNGAVVNTEIMGYEPMLLIRHTDGTEIQKKCWRYSYELDNVDDKWPFKISVY